MLKIVLSGCSGKMGHAIAQLASTRSDLKIVAGIDKSADSLSFPVFESLSMCNVEADVVIDFSHPNCTLSLLDGCLNRKLPLVMATTGLSEDLFAKVQNAAKTIPVFYSSNMSYGVFVFTQLVQKAAKELFSDFDIEIVERHHNQKVDAPSGTAMSVLQSIQHVVPDSTPVFDRQPLRQKRCKKEIGMHSVRGGNIVGDHEVLFAGRSELIEIRHSALSKDIFAEGAFKAALFLKQQPKGFYQMKNMIE